MSSHKTLSGTHPLFIPSFLLHVLSQNMPSLNHLLSQHYAQAYRVNRTIRAKQRRPATQPRPSGVLGAPDQAQGTASPVFATQGSNGTNNVGPSGEFVFGQQNRASQSFDQTPPPNPFRIPPNVSFPPFQGSTNAEFKPAFAVPSSSDFAFTPPPINNPFSFSTQNSNQSSGFQGSIFNIPPSTPFGTSSSSAGGDTGAPKAAAQSAFSWGSSFSAPETQPKPQSNIFDTISTGPKPGQQPIFAFGQSSSQPQQPASNPFDQNSTSLFGVKPIFNQTPSQAELQTQSPIAAAPQTPIAQEQKTNTSLFGQQASPASQPQVIELSPRKDEDRMSTTPDSSPQAKGSATLRPFEFLNRSPKGPEEDNSNSQEVPRDLFGSLPQPAVIPETPTGTGQESSSFESRVGPLDLVSDITEKSSDDRAGLPQPSTPAGNGTEQTSPTRSNEPKEPPLFSMPSSEETGAVTSGLFERLNIPSPSPFLQISANLSPLVPDERSTHRTSHEANLSVGAAESSSLTVVSSSSDQLTLESTFGDPMWEKTPVAPEDFTDAQREQLAIGYQIRCVDVGLQQHILKNRSFHLESELVTKFYLDLKRRILNGEGLTAQILASKKRRASEEDNNETYGKRTKLDTHLEPIRPDNQITNGGWLNAPNRPKALLTEPALLPQVAISKSQADEKPFVNIFERPSEVAKQVPRDGAVSYPSLSTNAGSITSNLFKTILQNKEQDSASDIQKRDLEGDNVMNSPIRLQENLNRTDMSIHSNVPSLFAEKAPPANSVPASKPIYPVLQQPANPNAFPAISKVKGPPLFSVSPGSSFILPKFGTAQPVDFLSQFGKVAEENARKEKASRKADDFDSDEDDEAEWERKDAEQQRAKKQRLDETVKNKTAKFVPGKGFIISDQRTELGSTPGVSFSGALNGTISSDTNKSVLSNKSHSLGNGHNIFGHLSDVESGAEGSKIGDADDEETGSDGAVDDDRQNGSTDKVASDESQYRDRTPGMDKHSEPLASINPFGPPSSFAANKSNNLPPDTSEQSPNIGRSIFDRISKDQNGRALREITPPTDKSDETLTGASLSTSNSIFKQGSLGAGTNLFGQRTLEVAPNMFGQRTSEARANIFGKQSTDPITDIFGRRDLGGIAIIPQQQNSAAGANIVEEQDSEAGANVSEQQHPAAGANVVKEQTSEAGADVVKQPNSEVEADVVGQVSSEAKATIGEEPNSGAEANFDERRKPEDGAYISGQRDAETGVDIVGQVPSSTLDKTDITPASNPGLFPSTSITSIGSSTPLFTFAGSAGGDNTWKVNSPIKFGSSSSGPPGLTLTSPSPSKPSLGGLFGPSPAFSSSAANPSTDTPAKPSSSIFSFNAGKAPAVSGFGFNFGGPPTATIGTLAAPLAASNASSRATSPGIMTGDNSAAESNAEGAEDGSEKHEQLNLADKGPGEEDEDVLFAVKAKAMIFESSDKGWATRGVGKLRVLKHRDTAKTRVLLKQDPSGKLILNAALLGTMKYEYVQNKSVKLGVATDVGKLVTWLIRTGKDEDAVELARILEENKSN